MLTPAARLFLSGTAWNSAACAPLTGDASVRKYYRLRQGDHSAILMDASAIPETVRPFLHVGEHLSQLGFSTPKILVRDEANGFLVLEDFGDDTFTRLLDRGGDSEALFAIATDLLIALHQLPQASPPGLRVYHPEQMLADLNLFLEWCSRSVSEAGRDEFRAAWRDVLPLAHQVPVSLLLRDYHAANLMLLPQRTGIRRAGLLDFQDAYRGPVAYDLMSLVQDARRDVDEALRETMRARYLTAFPRLDATAFNTSLAVLAALRHTRVLGIFERLSQFEGKHEYKKLHCARVRNLLQSALRHPALDRVKRWMERYAR